MSDFASSPSDHFLSFPLLLIWILTLVFCWKVFPAILNSTGSATPSISSTGRNISGISPSSKIESSSSSKSIFPSSSRGDCPPPLPPATQNQSMSSKKKLISHLQLEACTKAKEAGKPPSCTSLVLSLVHHYNLDVNEPVLSNSFSIFHCSCLSGSLELVSSLSPLANIHRLTEHGDSPLYLAVYAAAHKAGRDADHDQAGVEIVRHLLLTGSQVNQSNLAGFTALHQASRLSSPELLRLLMDWGADPQARALDRSVESTRSISVMSRSSSVVTRSMTSKGARGEGLNQSYMLGEKKLKKH